MEQWTHHVEQHDDAEVDADCRTRGRHLRVIPDEGPAEGGEGADGDHPVDDDAKHSGNHHQDLWYHSNMQKQQNLTWN